MPAVPSHYCGADAKCYRGISHYCERQRQRRRRAVEDCAFLHQRSLSVPERSPGCVHVVPLEGMLLRGLFAGAHSCRAGARPCA